VVVASELPELKGGNWERGKAIFFGAEVGCAKCHTMAGQGGGIGPDLTNLPQRDYQSVLRDTKQPSYAINPDFIAQTIQLSDGHVLTGTVRTRGERLSIGDAQGRVTEVAREDVERIQASTLSIMPEGLLEKLGEKNTRDLLTFLLTKPPTMPDYGPLPPPPLRMRAEVDAILAGAPPPAPRKSLNIVLVTGRKDHGPGEHDYPAWQKVWQQLLSMSDSTAVEVATDWPSAEQLKRADVLVFYQQGTWNATRAAELDPFLRRGGGAVYIHYAVDGGSDAVGFSERIGLAWKGGQSKFRHGALDLSFAPAKEHPIARNFDRLHLHDESYWQLQGDPQRVQLLATGREDDRDQPLFWSKEHGQGRVFVSIPGHFAWSFDDPLFRVLLLRGIAWCGHAPVDQFNELVTPGARIE
jgi:putative heme-binding domain-containing protein